MNKTPFLILSFWLLAGCYSPSSKKDSIVSMQVVDRNGFSETISNQDRLNVYKNVDFLSSQPYEKVLRVYGKNHEGKSHSKLTSYHDNGGVWQYLEAVDGRAHGRYLEWHPNGKLNIEAFVIEGLADLSERALQNWVFDQTCSVWDENGNLEAEFTYDRGYLEGIAKYYHPNGKIHKILPYTHGKLDGTVERFTDEELPLEQIHYKNGQLDGTSIGNWSLSVSKYQEQYRDGLLIRGLYFDPQGLLLAEIENGHGKRALFQDGVLSSLIEYQNGLPEGLVQVFQKDGSLLSTYTLKNGIKNGEEWHYYKEKMPKLLLNWFEDKIQGMVKTWYENGVLESQREMRENNKHGLSFAYYMNGDLMLMEEYENDHLSNGSYYRKGDPDPVSIIEKGEGTATLYSPEGQFLSKVTYEKGMPLVH